MTQDALHMVAFSTAEDDATLVRATQNGDDSAFASWWRDMTASSSESLNA
jgi:hypothetical protein